MKQSLSELLRKSAKCLPAQRPKTNALAEYTPVLEKMHDAGHTPSSMADFLIREREFKPDERRKLRFRIIQLLGRHLPLEKFPIHSCHAAK